MSEWTRESAVAAIQDFHRRHGYQPVSNEATKFNRLPSFGVAVKLFGSWNAAIEAAGFRPYPPRSSAQAKTMAYRDRRGTTSSTPLEPDRVEATEDG